MRKILHSPAMWMAFFCAVLSIGLWAWLRGIPGPVWETNAPVAATSPSTDLTPPPLDNASPTPATTVNTTVAQPSRAPSPDSAAGEQNGQAPAATPAPSPDAAVAAATPAPSPDAAASPAPSASPKPTDAELAGPLPQKGPADTPAVAPAPSAAPLTPTPAPSAAPLEIGDIANQPKLWPKQVLLTATVKFPLVLNGVSVGTMQLPPGRPVNLRKVYPDGSIDIELQGSTTKVSAQSTDLLARARALAAQQK